MSAHVTSHGESRLDRTVGEIVAADYRTAQIFEKYDIDFCCGGKIPLQTICSEKRIDPAKILGEIDSLQNTPIEPDQNYSAWSLSFLADYIVNTHHAYLRENLHQIAAYARKIAEVHGATHPELIEIADIFDRIVGDMKSHLLEEEEVFFPAIKRIEAAGKEGRPPELSDVTVIRDNLAKLDSEHNLIGDAVHTIRDLSRDYAVPADACNTFKLAFRKLEAFEDDLHKHVHLENNILFPRAAKQC